MKSDYECVVVGGGPAGATAALSMQYHGIPADRILLVEKATLPRRKPCGGAVSNKALAVWRPMLGASRTAALVQDSIPIRAMWWGMGQRGYLLRWARPLGYLIHRDQFDAALLAQVPAEVRSGVAVVTHQAIPQGVQLTLSTGEAVTASYVIAADGATSRFRARQPRRAWAVDWEYPQVPGAPSNTLICDLALPAGLGYAWIFPKRDGLAVGVGGIESRPDWDAFAWFYSRYGLSAVEPKHQAGWTIPYWAEGQVPDLGTGRILLAGDAGGLADPLTGEGIRAAALSGFLAGQAVAAMIHNGAPPETATSLYTSALAPLLAENRNHLAWAYRLVRWGPTLLRMGPGVPWVLTRVIERYCGRGSSAAAA